jgi:four helix bundle protein
MSRNESFENLVVWKKAMDLVVTVYQLCQQSPLSKDWSMRDQLQGAAVSIPANIAEGYERGGRKEYIRYLTISKGSSGELRCLLTVAWQLKYFSKEIGTDVINDAVEISKMQKGLINSLSPDCD